MFGQSDKDYFEFLWKQKLKSDSYGEEYILGANLRVDEALRSLTSGNRLLDIGCGNGIMLSMARDRFQEVHGVDISESAVSVTRQKGIQASTVNLNVVPLPFPDGHFDSVTILSALQYFYDVDRVLRECHRILSPSGNLLLSVPNIRAIWRIGKLLIRGSFTGVSLDEGIYDGGTLHYFAWANIKTLLVRNGFDVASTRGIFCKPAFWTRFKDLGFLGVIKREFFSAEIFIKAVKISKDNI
jgi:methionine biosynthesis protein MetW